MEGEMVAGAVLGAAFGELLRAGLDLMEKAIHFKPVLQEITSQLLFLISVTKQLDELGIDFQQHTAYLRELIRGGKQLILECHDAVKPYSFLYYPKTPFYTKKLRKLDARLERASRNLLLQLNVQQMNKLVALENNDKSCDGYAGLVDKIKKIFMGYSKNYCTNSTLSNYVGNYQTTKLPLLFYHDKRLKGKTGPNFFDTLLGRTVEHIKVDPKEGVEGRIEEMIKKWGEGRFEKIFHRTFETTTVDDEKLQNWFGCDLSLILEEHHPHGPLTINPGVLFVSTTRLAFCSYNHTPHSNNTKSLYLKVVVPFELLKGFEFDEEEEYIQLISIDDQKFVFMNFRNYNDAKNCMQDIIPVAPPTCTPCHTLSSSKSPTKILA